MALQLTPTAITQLETYQKYLQEIGKVPSYELSQYFACGLPSVWMYLKSLGLEDTYFELIGNLKNRHLLFKEVFYLLLLTNGTNKFFPHVPQDFLIVDMPKDIKAAQIEISKPEFELAFAFTKDQLKETLELLAKPGKMIRIGNKNKAIGVMYNDDVYDVYHVDNPHALQFKSLDGCVDTILRSLGATNKSHLTAVIQVHDLNPEQSLKYTFTASKLFNKLLQESSMSQESLQYVLKYTLDAGLPAEFVRKLIENGADVNHSYAGINKLLHSAWRHVKNDMQHATEIFTMLLEKGAFLTPKEQEFYSEVDPKFLEHYNRLASNYPAAAAHSKLTNR